jgi:hypothetical protein
MPSTDFNGEPIVILGREGAERILAIADRAFHLFPEERRVVELIRQTFSIAKDEPTA